MCFGVLGINSYAADEIKQGEPAPYFGIIFNDEKAGSLLKEVSRIPILEEEISNLNEQIGVLKASGGNVDQQVSNLQQQIGLLNQRLEIERERTALEHERGEFYKEKFEATSKLLEKSDALTQKVIKEAEGKNMWRSIGIGAIIALITTIVVSAL